MLNKHYYLVQVIQYLCSLPKCDPTFNPIYPTCQGFSTLCPPVMRRIRMGELKTVLLFTSFSFLSHLPMTAAILPEGGSFISQVETHLSDGTTYISDSLSPETARLLSQINQHCQEVSELFNAWMPWSKCCGPPTTSSSRLICYVFAPFVR